MLDQLSPHPPSRPFTPAAASRPAMAELPPAERLARFRLARSRGVGPKRFHRLLHEHGSARAALAALEESCPGAVPGEAAALEEIARGHEAGAEWSVFGDGAHPAFGDDPAPFPPLLWRRGNPACLAGPAAVPAVAIVGAREASAPGRALAREFAAALAEAGLIVVSGLARGIDTEAHRAALSVAGGRSVAVLPCGIDRVYPARNVALARRMADPAGPGAVISALPVGTRVHPRNFPARNRLIAALAGAVIIIEAAERSGTILTARLAAELGREVLVVPGHPHDPRARGANRLIREGAILVRDVEDVFEALTSPFANPMAAPRPAARGGGADETAPAVQGATPPVSTAAAAPSLRGSGAARSENREKGRIRGLRRQDEEASPPATVGAAQLRDAAVRAACGKEKHEAPGSAGRRLLRDGKDRGGVQDEDIAGRRAGDAPPRSASATCDADPPRKAERGDRRPPSERPNTPFPGAVLAPAEREILALFTSEPVLEDRILRATSLPVRKAIALITHLELKGYLARLPDGRIRKLEETGHA